MSSSPLSSSASRRRSPASLLLAGASHWLYREAHAAAAGAHRHRQARRARRRRRRRQAGEEQPAAAGRARLHARLDQGRLDHEGRAQLSETRKLLVSAGFRSRDAIVVFTFFKLVSPLVFLAGAALYVYGIDPIGKGPMLDAAAVIGAALARQQAAGHRS